MSSIGTRDGDRPAEIVVTIILNYSGGWAYVVGNAVSVMTAERLRRLPVRRGAKQPKAPLPPPAICNIQWSRRQ